MLLLRGQREMQANDVAHKDMAWLEGEDLITQEFMFRGQRFIFSTDSRFLVEYGRPYIALVGRFAYYVVPQRWRTDRVVPLAHDAPETGAEGLVAATGFVVRDSYSSMHLPEKFRLRDAIVQLTGIRNSYMAIISVTICLEILMLLGPIQTQWIIDQAIPTSDIGMVMFIAFVFLLIASLQSGLMVFRSYMLDRLRVGTELSWTVEVYQRVLGDGVATVNSTVGRKLQIFRSVQNILSTVSSAALASLFDGLMAFFLLTLVAYVDAWLALVLVVAVTLYSIVKFAKMKTSERARRFMHERTSSQSSLMVEAVRGSANIRSFLAESNFARRFLEVSRDLAVKTEYLERQGGALSQLNFWILSVQRTIVVGVSASQVIAGKATIGSLFVLIVYSQQFTKRMAGLIDKIADLRGLRAQLDNINSVPALRCQEREVAASVAGGDGSLCLEDVAFIYDERQILKDVSLRMERASRLVVTGPSGAGKSTLVKIILGQLLPTSGALLRDGKDCLVCDCGEWIRGIGSVQQDDMLFTGTVLENITMFNATPQLERAMRCCQLACIDSEIESLRMGYHEIINPASPNLSRGQQQRILIARALYHTEDLVILDEALANIDLRTCEKIIDNIFKEDFGVLIVTHDKNIVEMFPDHLFLESI
ncbi:ATP-binding cassette domain-containing protein [Xanthomonas oryzae pv. oryzicola]|uniref:ATP-binding cassette domain-containing protein n=1 Tax=Xanthomonas oryzae TaxID=347 RepID=UPI003DA12EAA